MYRSLVVSILAISLGFACGACTKDDHGVAPTGDANLTRQPPACVHVDPADVHPADFGGPIDNPYLPFTPGTEYVYRSVTDEGLEETRTFVTYDTKEIIGVTCTVVHDRVFTDGDLTEDTFDWYAQDKDGNVWYFGEDTKELDHGVVTSTEGTWMAGENDAQPGIVMLKCPRVGDAYRQEFSLGVAQDEARIRNLAVDVTVTYGSFDDCLEILETTPLEKGLREYKDYAAGTGLVREVQPGGKSLNQLVEINHISP